MHRITKQMLLKIGFKREPGPFDLYRRNLALIDCLGKQWQIQVSLGTPTRVSILTQCCETIPDDAIPMDERRLVALIFALSAEKVATPNRDELLVAADVLEERAFMEVANHLRWMAGALPMETAVELRA